MQSSRQLLLEGRWPPRLLALAAVQDRRSRQRVLQESWLRRPLAHAWVPQERVAQCSRQRLLQGPRPPRPLALAVAQGRVSLQWLLQVRWPPRPLAPAWVAQERAAQCSRQGLLQGRWPPRPLALAVAGQGHLGHISRNGLLLGGCKADLALPAAAALARAFWISSARGVFDWPKRERQRLLENQATPPAVQEPRPTSSRQRLRLGSQALSSKGG